MFRKQGNVHGAFVALVATAAGIASLPKTMAAEDKGSWDVRPSMVLDALCFINSLTGDPYYLERYEEEYSRFSGYLTPPVDSALAELKRVIKDEGGGIISATLALYYSVTPDSTLQDLIRTAEEPAGMRRLLGETPYYSDAGWQVFDQIRPALATVLRWLQAVEFDTYWELEIRPIVERRIAEVEPDLEHFDVIPAIRGIPGFDLPTDQITVFMLYFTRPHGIRVTGYRFITDVTWPIEIVVNTAIHEMLHPPYRLDEADNLREALESLRRDTFVMSHFEDHDPSFGYNTFWGYVEENIVQALDQLLSEGFDAAPDPHRNWREADGGMHVLAVAVYSAMKEQGFPESGEALCDFLIRNVTTGSLQPGRIRDVYTSFYAGAPDRKGTDEPSD